MDTKLFARIGAGAFVAAALVVAVLDLRDEPKAPLPDIMTVLEPDSDPLPVRLKACAAMGELALSSPDCRVAWAEKRRRFLGVNAQVTPSEPDTLPAGDASAMSDPSAAKVN